MTNTKIADKAGEPAPEQEPEAAKEADTEQEPDSAKEPEAAEKEPDEAPEPASETAPERKSPLVRVAMVVTVAAAVAAAWFGWSAYSAAQDDDLAYASLRDEVLRSAEQGVVNLNTLDHRNADAGLKVWQDSTTDKLYEQIVQGRERLKADIEEARTTSTAKVLESGLTELDSHAGKAAVIMAVRTTITAGDGKPTSQIRRLMGRLTKTSSGWKFADLGAAPTGTAGS